MSDMDDLFKEFFEDGGQVPPATPEQIRMEAMTITELHIQAFNDAVDNLSGNGWHEMLGSWYDELSHFLPTLEEFEEYEQCAKVFKTMNELREVSANIGLNKSLTDLPINIVHEGKNQSDEPDF